MADAESADRMDEAFQAARAGNRSAFADWMGMVEIPLRRSLSRFARAVDIEAAVQETFMRMWLIACDPGREITGNHASLRFAFRVARNVALEEVRRYRQEQFVDLNTLEDLPQGRVESDLPDPALSRAIRECMQRLPEKPRRALSARIRDGTLRDRQLAESVRMKLNTFIQNIVRARRQLRACLERRGVRLEEIMS